MKTIKNKLGESFLFRRLTQNDAVALGNYFEALSEESKSKFHPHALTKNYATFLCHRTVEKALRYVLTDASGMLVGYYIFDFDLIPAEVSRYASYGIHLEEGKDVFFAPSLADKHQNKGISSHLMPPIVEIMKENQVRSLVLMGGVQESNTLALGFYEKFGFKKKGGYLSDLYNIDLQLDFF